MAEDDRHRRGRANGQYGDRGRAQRRATARAVSVKFTVKLLPTVPFTLTGTLTVLAAPSPSANVTLCVVAVMLVPDLPVPSVVANVTDTIPADPPVRVHADRNGSCIVGDAVSGRRNCNDPGDGVLVAVIVNTAVLCVPSVARQ